MPDVPVIANPRRTLLLGGPDSGVLPLLKELTGTAPDPRIIPAQNTHATGSGHGTVTPLIQEDSRDAFEADPSNPEDEETTTTTSAGLTHTLSLDTKYYKATIPCWLDEATSAETWCKDFSSPEAAEVVKAVGAWIIVFREERASRHLAAADSRGEPLVVGSDDEHEGGASNGQGRDGAAKLMRGVRDAIEAAHGGPGIWDGVCLVIQMPKSSTQPTKSRTKATMADPMATRLDDEAMQQEEADEAWEDMCYDLGFEYVDCSTKAQPIKDGESGSREKVGVARVREALEACDWEDMRDVDPLLDGEDQVLDATNDETKGFELEHGQMEAEFAKLKNSMSREPDLDDAEFAEDEALQVEQLGRMMQKVTAVREMSAHMPEQERRRLAAKTVDDIMKNM